MATIQGQSLWAVQFAEIAPQTFKGPRVMKQAISAPEERRNQVFVMGKQVAQESRLKIDIRRRKEHIVTPRQIHRIQRRIEDLCQDRKAFGMHHGAVMRLACVAGQRRDAPIECGPSLKLPAGIIVAVALHGDKAQMIRSIQDLRYLIDVAGNKTSTITEGRADRD